MPSDSCPVHSAGRALDEAIRSGRLRHPAARRMAEEIRDLLRDISWGRAGEDHLPALEALAAELAHTASGDAGREIGQGIQEFLATRREAVLSHIATHNCPTGDCVRLAPAPCQMTCPAGIDVPTYVSLIAQERFAEAIDVVRRDNPFPWVCGLVCTRPCEFMCVRGRMDSPVAIKALKAYAAEKALSDLAYHNPPLEPEKDAHVAVVGAGPAGMSAAYYLALKGYGVRIFESLPMAGGMMMVGIPRYRLPREVIDREVAMLRELGVAFSFGTRFGRDVSLEGLKKEGYKAFFLAIGAHKCFPLQIPGEHDFPQVLDAIGFLRAVAMGNRQRPGRRVIVIGGGNVAIDAARTALRLGAENVSIAYRRTHAEMPADREEVEQAEEEGVRFSFLTIPIGIVGEGQKLAALHCLRAEMKEQPGDSRKRPVPVEGSNFYLEADVVIRAIGQQADFECLAELSGLDWTRRLTIDTNMVSMETSVEGVFAAGDAVTGPATVIEAIGGGKRAAEAIDRYLRGIPQPKMPPVPVRRGRVPVLDIPAAAKAYRKRPPMPLLNVERRRTTFQQVELGFTRETAREEAARCLRCDICLRCGTCVSICRDKMRIDALKIGYLDFDHPGATDLRVTAEHCILCGACAANCPNGAIRIEDRDGERILSLCGTVLNRQKLLYCESCGEVLGPARYLDFVQRRTRSVARAVGQHALCDACARRETAAFKVENAPIYGHNYRKNKQ